MRTATEVQDCEIYLQDNWDGEDAKGLSPATLHNAKVIAALLPSKLPHGSAMAGVDGSFGMAWYFHLQDTGRIQLFIDVRADGGIRYYASRKEDYKNEESFEEVIQAGTPIEVVMDKLSPCFPWWDEI